jgi:ribosomal protein S18 acetylase RimI-like enzyme
LTVRRATDGDFDAIARIDMWPALTHDADRRLRAYVARGGVLVAELDGALAGFVDAGGDFFGYPFVPLLAVGREHRRRGIAERLLAEAAATVEGDRLFISTAETNVPMQAVLAKCGFERCGAVEHVDPGDRELFYVKFLR